MTAIIPLSGAKHLPAYLANRSVLPTINAEVLPGSGGFPVMSIKGKVFTLVKDGERKVLTKPDDPEETLQSIEATVVRANSKHRVFYAKSYVEGAEGDVAKPDCHSVDGIAPAPDSRAPQAAKCSICPHSVWGSKTGTEGKGTACTVNTRLAVVDPNYILGAEKIEPFLLRVPAGSRANFADVVKTANARGIPYNALALKIGFDKEAPSPKLTFRIVGLLDDPAYNAVNDIYEDDTVKTIVGLAPARDAEPAAPPAAKAPAAEEDLDTALAAKAAKESAAEKAKKAVARAATRAEEAPEDLDAALAGLDAAPNKPAADVEDVVAKAPPAPAPAPARRTRAPAAAPAARSEEPGFDNLLEGLDSLLSATDD